MFSVHIDKGEIEKALKNLERLSEHAGVGIETMLLREGAEMEKEIKSDLSVGGGVKGKGPRGGKLRQHSPPGQPPYLQSGRLRASIGYVTYVAKKAGAYVLDIGAIRKVRAGEVVYAEALELGTSSMAPRPYLMPAVMRHIRGWESGLNRIFGRFR